MAGNFKKIAAQNVAKKMWLVGTPQEIAAACAKKLYRQPKSSSLLEVAVAASRSENEGAVRTVYDMEKIRATEPQIETDNRNKVAYDGTNPTLLQAIMKKTNKGNMGSTSKPGKTPTLKIYNSNRSFGSSTSSTFSAFRRNRRTRPDAYPTLMTRLSSQMLSSAVAATYGQPARNQHMSTIGTVIQVVNMGDLLPLDKETKNLISVRDKPKKKKELSIPGVPPTIKQFNPYQAELSMAHAELLQQYQRLKRTNKVKQIDNLRYSTQMTANDEFIENHTTLATAFDKTKFDRVLQFINGINGKTLTPGQPVPHLIWGMKPAEAKKKSSKPSLSSSRTKTPLGKKTAAKISKMKTAARVVNVYKQNIEPTACGEIIASAGAGLKKFKVFEGGVIPEKDKGSGTQTSGANSGTIARPNLIKPAVPTIKLSDIKDKLYVEGNTLTVGLKDNANVKYSIYGETEEPVASASSVTISKANKTKFNPMKPITHVLGIPRINPNKADDNASTSGMAEKDTKTPSNVAEVEKRTFPNTDTNKLAKRPGFLATLLGSQGMAPECRNMPGLVGRHQLNPNPLKKYTAAGPADVFAEGKAKKMPAVRVSQSRTVSATEVAFKSPPHQLEVPKPVRSIAQPKAPLATPTSILLSSQQSPTDTTESRFNRLNFIKGQKKTY